MFYSLGQTNTNFHLIVFSGSHYGFQAVLFTRRSTCCRLFFMHMRNEHTKRQRKFFSEYTLFVHFLFWQTYWNNCQLVEQAQPCSVAKSTQQLGEKSELGSNQSVFCHGPTLFSKYVEVRNKGFNWPVCAECRCPNSKQISCRKFSQFCLFRGDYKILTRFYNGGGSINK